MALLTQGAVGQETTPAGPWIMHQTWHNLLFAHWPLTASTLRPLVPAPLEIDTFGGRAWVGVVAFRLSGVRFRGCPPLPGVTQFPEINVRTYVKVNGKPGVLFLSLDTDHRMVVELARQFFRLAYVPARVRLEETEEGVQFTSRRPDGAAAFAATYRPWSSAYTTAPGTLEHWLTERYCYYSVTPRGEVYRCDVDHAPWRLQWAEATIAENTMLQAHGLPAPTDAPLLHYAETMQARIWPLRRLAAVPVGRPARPRLLANEPAGPRR